MKKERSIKLNFIMNTILTMSSLVFPLITFPYVSRILLPEGTGKVSFAISIVSYFVMFARLGIPTYGIRACAKVRDDKKELSRIVHELFIINILIGTIAYISLIYMVFHIPLLRSELYLYLIVSTTILFDSVGMEWLYKALEQYTYITVRSIIFKFIALIAMLLFVHNKNDYILYGGISIFASSASNIFNFIHIHKYIYVHPVGNYRFARHLKGVGVFFAMSCATTLYTHLDTIMLGFMTSNADVGYYNAAVKIKSVLVSIVTSLGPVVLPRASYYIQHGMYEKFQRISQKALNVVLLLALPLTVFFILYAKQGIYFLSGAAYTKSIIPMQIIMPTLLFIGITNIFGIQILVPLGLEKIVLRSEIAGAIINMVVNYILIPRMAATGAAIGTVVAEFVVLLVQFEALKDYISKLDRKVHYEKILLALVFSSLGSIWVNVMGWNNILILTFAACLFFGIYCGFLLLVKESLAIELSEQVIHSLLKKFHK